MFTFDMLVFKPTLIEGNTIAEVNLDNGYSFDVIRKVKEKVYKVKGFEKKDGKKYYNPSYFEAYEQHPEFNSKEVLLTFINELTHFRNRNEEPEELEEELEEELDLDSEIEEEEE